MSKKVIIGLITLLVIGVGGYFLIGKMLWSPNVKPNAKKSEVFIPTNASIEDVMDSLQAADVLKDMTSFKTVAKLKSFNKAKPGRYVFDENMSNIRIINKLRSGDQDAEQVVINNIRLISDLAGKASNYFESDSLAFLNYLTNPEVSAKFGFTQENFLSMFIPNTYEMFWTATPEKFTERMQKEYNKFWTDERLAKIAKNKLSQIEAYTLASIVEKESNYDPERPTIAGVYLNRLKAGEKLQADPTVVFATGDFSLQRVLYSHLKTESPYNTYMNHGLPPGPICMPSLASLEAVINAEDHKYMFFCAKADNSGIHAFAESYADHLKNADAFAAWMNSLNIK